MAAPNIVNVATITGVTTWKAGISTLPGTPSVVVSNAASSGKVIKINSIVAVAVGATTGVTVKLYTEAAGAGASVAIADTMSVPENSSLAVISKETSLYLEEDKSIAVYKQDAAGDIDVVCSYEDIS
tara:strand:- start:24 stop:404 length:381 start_codon:yes stop_codon:yes gene_type:complete